VNIPRAALWPMTICAALCAIFAAIAWTAASGKSATADEPNHVATGWFMLWQADFRLSPDVPPLWEDFIALGIERDSLRFDPASPQYRNIFVHRQMADYCNHVLYSTPGIDGVEVVNRARAMCLILGVALAVLIACWAWQLAGPAAAVVATFVYCFDPNFLGHAALAKNDVASALIFFATSYAIWRAGMRMTWPSAGAVVLLTAAAVAVKFSGLLLGPVLILTLGYRAFSAQPWIIFGKPRGKSAAAFLLCTATAVVTYIGLWALYDFRFDAGPDGLRLDTSVIVNRLRELQLRQHPADAATWQPPLLTRLDLFIAQHRLMPQAWATGFINTENEDQGQRSSFLMGQSYPGGKWYYFPLAAIFKEPLATIAAALAAILAIRPGMFRSLESRWAAVCLFVPAAVYGFACLTAQVNIGLRHAFPIFPFVFVALGLAWGRRWELPLGRWVVAVLGLLLIVETARAYPNFIAFFNAASDSRRTSLLTDSNLDWGQDLPALAAWQRKNPDVKLYLDYFGRCDPAVYGIRYVKLPDGFAELQRRPASERPVVAISETILQQFNGNPAGLAEFAIHSGQQPRKILDKTIYLFDVER
jgi:hypothetical protein